MNALRRKPARWFLYALALVSLCYLGLNFIVLRADGLTGRVGMVANPQAPSTEWKFVPAANAEVVVAWQFRRLPGPETRLRCLYARLARTDAQGNFQVDGWLVPLTWPLRLPTQPHAQGVVDGSEPLEAASWPADPAGFTHLLKPAANGVGPTALEVTRAAGCRVLEERVRLSESPPLPRR